MGTSFCDRDQKDLADSYSCRSSRADRALLHSRRGKRDLEVSQAPGISWETVPGKIIVSTRLFLIAFYH